MRILVADDDREIVELLNIYLHNEGYDVIKAYNGHQALSYIKNDVDLEIGLIILDIMMPKVDGMQVLDKLRAANYETPVLMLSAKVQIKTRFKDWPVGLMTMSPSHSTH